MEVVSSSNFRGQMNEYMRKALSTEVVIESKKYGHFRLVPIEADDDTLMSQEAFEQKILHSFERMKAGEYAMCGTADEIIAHYESLQD